jgi:asparagine synthase (glutamine-hydrolysing)
MCGITGFINFEGNLLSYAEKWSHTLGKMNDTLSRRGPDDKGTLMKNHFAFGHRRLAIRDVQHGTQPMVRTFHDFDYAICYNGEIYNTKELKDDLAAKGYNFTTSSDTEILLTGLAHYKESFIYKLNGIFSIAFWNGKDQEVLLIRDRAGIKPLFYTREKDFLVFGSEIKALLQFPDIVPKLDKNGLLEIFGLGPARTPGNGVLKGIQDVLPGEYIKINKEKTSHIQYWDLQSEEHVDDYDTTVDKVSKLLKDSVKLQMLSDVPVCSFLSGGVDSSVVTALAAKYLAEKGERLQTFSFDFKGNDKHFKSNSFQPDQDRPYAVKVASHYNTNHTFLECNNEILADYLYKAVDAKDLPGMADVESSLLYFCEQVSKTHKVALTGECADEIFGGYPWFHKKEMFDANIFPWSSDLEARKILLKDTLIHDLSLNQYVQHQYDTSIKKVPALASDSAEEKRRRQLGYLNIKWFMATLVDRMDRTSMYSGLEARVPFADHRIMEYVFNIPWSIKCRDGMVKHLLRKASEGLLPDEILYRKKSPYPKTYNPEYEAIISERLRFILSDKNEPIHNFIDVDKTNLFLSAPSDYGKPWYGQLMAGPQMIAYMLQINYWLKKYHVTIL